MKTFNYFLIFGLASMFFVGCQKNNDSVGEFSGYKLLNQYSNNYVTVQFRRDMLGASVDLPIGPTTQKINGANTSLRGRLKWSSENSVLISSGNDAIWIPRESILLIQISE